MKTLSWSAAVALLALVVCAPNAGAETTKCQKAIAKSGAAFAQAKVKALAKCNEGIIKTGAGTCPDTKATTAIDKAEAKMRSTIDKTCGGDDKVCGGDQNGEDLPPSLSWPNVCPNFQKGLCDFSIADCGDIADCLACVNDNTVDQAISLYYDSLVLPSVGNKPLNSCQVAIGKSAAAFIGAKSKALQKCWDARLAGKHANSCIPPALGDGKYIAAITKADTKMQTTICKACGGADKACGGGDDQTPAAIGFPASCPPVTVPGGAACGGAITDLTSLKNCVACVSEFDVDCADRLQVPNLGGALPAECNVCGALPPTGPCPSTIQFTANGNDADLDTGSTGLAHEATVPTNGRLTLAVSNCAGGSQPTCGQCDVDGPLPNAGGPAFQTKRCSDQSWVQCSTDTDCTNAGAIGPCIFFFGAPLPLRAGGVSTCVVNRINGSVSGTINVEAGSSTTAVPLNSQVGTSPSVFTPCPVCTGGTCSDGPRSGQACTVTGTSIFGPTSLDCPPPPASIVANLGINLNIATGEQTRTLTAASPQCRATGYDTLACHCDTCNSATLKGCAANADCPASGGEAGICGGKRCIGGPLAGNPCLQCLGGANHGANCSTASSCPGGTCPDTCGVCLGGTNNGNSCNANAQCPSSCAGGTNDGGVCANNSACPGGTCTVGVVCQGNCGRPGVSPQPDQCDPPIFPETEACAATGDNHGMCTNTIDSICSIQRFLTCSADADCNPPSVPGGTCPNCIPGQSCVSLNRSCFPGNGVIGSEVKVSGLEDAPCNGVSRPTVGSFFCVAPVGSTAVNSASGLPGLGRVRLPGVAIVDP